MPSSLYAEECHQVLVAHEYRASRDNHFNLLRLTLASLVIIGHALMLKTGDFHLDPAFTLGGTLDMHSLAVDAFFMLSGCLITASWMAKPKLRDFAEKRVRRIYPGFIACFLVCVLAVAPLAGPEQHLPILSNLRHLIVLSAPISTTFDGLLNPPMWTIQFEFACYAMVAALGMARCLNRGTVAALLIVTIGLSFTHPSMWYAEKAIRLAPFFLAGMCACLWKPKWSAWWGAVAAGLTICGLSTPWGIRLILPLAGAYTLFAVAFSGSRALTALRPKHDISYGVYLYGWPVQKLILMYWPSVALVPYIVCSLAGASILAFASWKLVEEPFMRRKKSIIHNLPVCPCQP